MRSNNVDNSNLNCNSAILQFPCVDLYQTVVLNFYSSINDDLLRSYKFSAIVLGIKEKGHSSNIECYNLGLHYQVQILEMLMQNNISSLMSTIIETEGVIIPKI